MLIPGDTVMLRRGKEFPIHATNLPLPQLNFVSQVMGVAGKVLRVAANECRRARLRPELATPNLPVLELRTLTLRDCSAPGASGVPTIVLAPYAGHTAAIADFAPGQSLVQALHDGGAGRIFLTDWHPATVGMCNLDIDYYLSDLALCVDQVGGRANLVGLCQGGWMAAMFAARFPSKVAALVLAGSPIDTQAGDGPLKRMVNSAPPGFYEALVAAGGGLMRGDFMLQGWKSLDPARHYIQRPLELLENVDDKAWVQRDDRFTTWYETTVDLPGRWYLQAINQIFRENRLARGEFVALGRKVSLSDVTCPAFLIAGEEDDITTPEQVFAAERLLGSDNGVVCSRLVPGGHIGLFMGTRAVREVWPDVAMWLAKLNRAQPDAGEGAPRRKPVRRTLG